MPRLQVVGSEKQPIGAAEQEGVAEVPVAADRVGRSRPTGPPEVLVRVEEPLHAPPGDVAGRDILPGPSPSRRPSPGPKTRPMADEVYIQESR